MKRLRILVVRRDNIGDLLCTTPLIDTLRAHYPDAEIDALVNSYNAPILEGNPALNVVHVYTKGKHRAAGQTALGVVIDTARLVWRMRRRRYDMIFLPGHANRNSHKYARWVRHAHTRVIGFGSLEDKGQNGPVNVPVDSTPFRALHEVSKCQALLTPLGVDDAPGAMRVFARPAMVALAEQRFADAGVRRDGHLIGLHISARRPLQRWPAERFIELAHALYAQDPTARFALFWSPGASDTLQHPGDDRNAEAIMNGCRDLPMLALPTRQLPELIGALSLVDSLICSDGGAMHLAAALGKPIVSLFGDSVSAHWHPWEVPHEVLQPESRDVRDLDAARVCEAHRTLMARVRA
jgi:ADP-heptose:LPS heptosyltransferase